MMSSVDELQDEPVIKIEDVSLRYFVPRERINSLKEYVIRRAQGKIVHEEFWALRNISVEINKGEMFGIVGQNGAGKSTMLKLIAKVLKPITGRVWVRGKVAPLLSVGAGFHHELTGRENIFLNGTLLGFTQRQIEEKFDRIVEFAELADFIDAPIRSYSSGMIARLGFAIATDSRPDILIVDEVLAVGDEAFQAKCFARMQDYRDQGMTTLLVTHNSDRVRKFCTRAIWLHKGEVKMLGSVDEVVSGYNEAFGLKPTKPVVVRNPQGQQQNRPQGQQNNVQNRLQGQPQNNIQNRPQGQQQNNIQNRPQGRPQNNIQNRPQGQQQNVQNRPQSQQQNWLPDQQQNSHKANLTVRRKTIYKINRKANQKAKKEKGGE